VLAPALRTAAPVLNDSEKIGCRDIAGTGEGQVERVSRDDDAAQHRVSQHRELASAFPVRA
jgi:hypothetical protein